MFEISREYKFSAAHRLEGHPKCGRLHGHNYKVVLHLSSNTLDEMGFIMDFGDVDEHIKPLIDQMDHMYLSSLSNAQANDPYSQIASDRGEIFKFPAQDSTAEWMASVFHAHVMNSIRGSGDPISIRAFIEVWETDRNRAIYRPPHVEYTITETGRVSP